jgi:TPR repeat protein
LQDYAEAVKWIRLAAIQGNDYAQYHLGTMYLLGQGIPQDYVRAHMWSNLAAALGTLADASGIDMAATQRDLVAEKMTSAQVSEAQRMARECLERNFKNCD